MKLFITGAIMLIGYTISFPADAHSLLNKSMLNINPALLKDFEEDEEEYTKEFKVQPGKLLEIDLNTGGGLDISGWDKDEFQAKVTLEGRDSKDIDLKFEETPEGIKITSEYKEHKNKRNGGADLEIKVPRSFNLKMETMGGGIVLKDLEGDFDGNTMGGGLQLTKLKGRVHLKTMGGGISLTDSELDGSVSTMGGNVIIKDVKGNVKGSSMGGMVKYENVTSRDGKSSGREVKITSMGGAIDVDQAPEGADVSTMGGSISIKSARHHVKAKTMGGNITIDDIQGWIDATTMAGNVNVDVTGSLSEGKQDIKITSMSGDITLTLPASFPMDVTVEVSFDEKNREKYKIMSDFELKLEETEDKDNNNFDPRMLLTGKGSFNGGKNKVYIKTMNGKVSLKKG